MVFDPAGQFYFSPSIFLNHLKLFTMDEYYFIIEYELIKREKKTAGNYVP